MLTSGRVRTWCVRACLSHRRRDKRTGGSPPSLRCSKRARTRGDALGTAAECTVVEPSRRPNAAFPSETAGRKRPDRFWCRSPPRDDWRALPLTVRSRGVEGPIHEPRGRVRGTKGTLARDANSHALVLTGRHRDAGRGRGSEPAAKDGHLELQVQEGVQVKGRREARAGSGHRGGPTGARSQDSEKETERVRQARGGETRRTDPGSQTNDAPVAKNNQK